MSRYASSTYPLYSFLLKNSLSLGERVLEFLTFGLTVMECRDTSFSHFFMALSISGFIACFEWAGIYRSGWSFFRTYRFPHADIYEITLRVLILATIPIFLVHVLTPVWDYDALLYHLEIPRQFIAHEGIFFNQDMMRSA